MNNLINQFIIDLENKQESNCDAETKLKQLRALSNVQSALKNLIVQCEASHVFDNLKALAHRAHTSVTDEMQSLIHRETRFQ